MSPSTPPARVKLSENFYADEFECKHCKTGSMQPMFITRLQTARTFAGIPFSIASGFRCPEHNNKVGGEANSSHLRGWAADIRCTDDSARWKIIDGLTAAGFVRIEVDWVHVHVDMDPSLPQKIFDVRPILKGG